MITDKISFSEASLRHISTFDNTPTHWDGTCEARTKLRKEIRMFYLPLQKNHCPYCNRLRQEWHGALWDIDHIIDKNSHAHYMYHPSNLIVTCKDCNVRKSTKNVLAPAVNSLDAYPSRTENYIIIHPHFDEYSENIETEYNSEHKIIHKPITLKGGETYSICGLIRFTEDLADAADYIPEESTSYGMTHERTKRLFDIMDNVRVEEMNDQENDAEYLMHALSQITGLDYDAISNSLRNLEPR